MAIDPNIGEKAYRQLKLNKEWVRSNVRLTVEERDDLGEEMLARYIDHRIEMMVAALGDIETEKHVAVPASWWQHFKQDVLPAWWTQRWPVKTKIITLKVKHFQRVCPHLTEMRDYRHLGERPHIEFMLMDWDEFPPEC